MEIEKIKEKNWLNLCEASKNNHHKSRQIWREIKKLNSNKNENNKNMTELYNIYIYEK